MLNYIYMQKPKNWFFERFSLENCRTLPLSVIGAWNEVGARAVHEVCISVIRLSRDPNVDNFSSICWRGSLGEVRPPVREAEGDSEDDLVSSECSLELLPLVESHLTIRICHSYTGSTHIHKLVLPITNCFKYSAEGMIDFFTTVTCVIFCFDDLFAATAYLVHLESE